MAPVVRQLVAGLAAGGNATASGIVGTAYLLQVLHAHVPRLALTVATATTAPSWGHMVAVGPGTLWESWTDSTNSHNHPALGATVAPYLYALAGLQPWDARTWSAGGAVVVVRPAPAVVRVVGAASASVATVRGRVSVAWVWHHSGSEHSGAEWLRAAPNNNVTGHAVFSIRTDVPAGMAADVHVDAHGTRGSCAVYAHTTLGEQVVWSWDRGSMCAAQGLGMCTAATVAWHHSDGAPTVAVRVAAGVSVLHVRCSTT